MPLVELEDIRLYYEEHGRGPALVLTNHSRVIVYDARGHGLSDSPREASAYSQQHMVDDL
jgi:pimeloyl-ACP methyl ester carboxylesterase